MAVNPNLFGFNQQRILFLMSVGVGLVIPATHLALLALLYCNPLSPG